MVLMHCGIAMLMSAKVGLAFFTSLPGYALGFGSPVAVNTAPWYVAVAVAFLPTFASLFVFQRPLPENWPSNPFRLFMWSGAQAEGLINLTMKGDTRLVTT
jgi:hypothetical protein